MSSAAVVIGALRIKTDTKSPGKLTLLSAYIKSRFGLWVVGWCDGAG